MSQDSRERMIHSAAALLAARGMTATSFGEVLAASGAPRGSIYHHFPQGKTELTQAAVRFVAQGVLHYQSTCQATTPAGVLRHFSALWQKIVRASQGQSGCALAGTALDTTPEDQPVLLTVRDAFREWIDLLTTQLTGAGLPEAEARKLALTTLSTLEGALILCRAEGSSAPLDTAAETLLKLLETS